MSFTDKKTAFLKMIHLNIIIDKQILKKKVKKVLIYSCVSISVVLQLICPGERLFFEPYKTADLFLLPETDGIPSVQ
jgi:hypothetical protein